MRIATMLFVAGVGLFPAAANSQFMDGFSKGFNNSFERGQQRKHERRMQEERFRHEQELQRQREQQHDGPIRSLAIRQADDFYHLKDRDLYVLTIGCGNRAYSSDSFLDPQGGLIVFLGNPPTQCRVARVLKQ